ncbi:MAG: universal stress protein [Bacteroidota bacterium]
MKKILVPCDFSEISENALDYAIELTKYFSGSLVLLHIAQIPVMNPEFGMTGYAYPDMVHDGEESLKHLAHRIQRDNPLITNIECHSEMGIASDTVLDYTNKHNVDLIVMGISGHGSNFMKALFGSTAVTISKKAAIPVIIVPPEYKFQKIQNIAYACDYDKRIENNTSLIQVKYLNTLLGANLQVLHVIPEGHELNLEESKIDCYVEEKLENAMHKTYIIAEKSVSEGLLMFIENHDIDMVIVEPKKHSFFYKLFHESVTNQMAFFSPVPVLTIHG